MLLHVILYVIIGDVENNNNILLYPPSLFLILSLFYFLPFFNVVLLVFFSYIFFRIYFFVYIFSSTLCFLKSFVSPQEWIAVGKCLTLGERWNAHEMTPPKRDDNVVPSLSRWPSYQWPSPAGLGLSLRPFFPFPFSLQWTRSLVFFYLVKMGRSSVRRYRFCAKEEDMLCR